MSLLEIPKSHIAKTVSLVPVVVRKSKTGIIKKAAFTLAETLITVVIIGVVAALTIPTLMSKYQKQTYVTGLKKAYSVITNAVKMMPMTEGCSPGDYSCLSFDWTGMDGKVLSALKKQLKVVKSCTMENAEECADIEALSKEPYCFGVQFCGIPNLIGTIITDDGMSFATSSLGLFVDVNGIKGPNKYGRDIFIFDMDASNEGPNTLLTGKVIPVGSQEYGKKYGEEYYWNNNPSNPGCNGKDAETMFLCAGRVLEEDAMNY